MMLDTRARLKHNLMLALVSVVGLGGTAVVWGVTTPLAGAVVARGTVVVENSVKKVQHPAGGVVAELNVREDEHVVAGQIVARLEATEARANLAIVLNEQDALSARLVRLTAERDGIASLDFPQSMLGRAEKDRGLAAVLQGERRVFDARLRTVRGQKDQLKERIEQTLQEIAGLNEQAKSLAEQIAIGLAELDDYKTLEGKGLIQRTKITTLRKEISRNEGLAGDLKSKIAGANEKIAETRLQIIQLDSDNSSEAAKELRDVETKLGELREKKLAAEEQLRRIDIRAPIAGRVHQLSMHTIGGVVGPAEQLMLIVPDADVLIIEAQIAPHDIDQLHGGQETRVRFSAFNQRTTPEVLGEVSRISADVTKDTQSGLEYFTAGIYVAPDRMRALRGLSIVPGMPAEVYIKTGERTLASYLLKPVMDQMERAMREE